MLWSFFNMLNINGTASLMRITKMFKISIFHFNNEIFNISIYTKRITKLFIKNWLLGRFSSNFTFCMGGSNSLFIELEFKCKTTNLFKFSFKVTFKRLILLKCLILLFLDLYSAPLLQTFTSLLALSKIYGNRNSFEISYIKLLEIIKLTSLLKWCLD